VRAEDGAEKLRRHFVVLAVGGVGVQGDGLRAEARHPLRPVFCGVCGVRGVRRRPVLLATQAFGEEAADAEADERVRQQAAVEERGREADVQEKARRPGGGGLSGATSAGTRSMSGRAIPHSMARARRLGQLGERKVAAPRRTPPA